jgi:hypothetical protein
MSQTRSHQHLGALRTCHFRARRLTTQAPIVRGRCFFASALAAQPPPPLLPHTGAGGLTPVRPRVRRQSAPVHERAEATVMTVRSSPPDFHLVARTTDLVIPPLVERVAPSRLAICLLRSFATQIALVLELVRHWRGFLRHRDVITRPTPDADVPSPKPSDLAEE